MLHSVSMLTTSEHTSDSPDIFSSSPEYAKRFSGEIGQWFLEIQGNTVKELLNNSKELQIADIGGGHAQLVNYLLSLNARITVTGSNSQCAGQLDDYLKNRQCLFVQANMLALPFPDKSFDAVICLRQISHISDWQKLIQELTRIAGNKVIIDFPPLLSFNIFYRLLFPIKRLFEKNTREFLIFSKQQIVEEFRIRGFILTAYKPQFLMPMVFYRMIKNRRISDRLEKLFRTCRLTAIFGSPVIAEFSRINL